MTNTARKITLSTANLKRMTCAKYPEILHIFNCSVSRDVMQLTDDQILVEQKNYVVEQTSGVREGTVRQWKRPKVKHWLSPILP